jgi:PAS domain S-box-containing protein
MEITKCLSPISIALEQLTVHFRSAQRALSRVGRTVSDRGQRLQDTLHAREHEMRELLASSLDAIVVVSADHSLIAANSKARELFGISQRNIREFNVDAFLSPGQIPGLAENSRPFIRHKEKHGVCEIRRLDGGVRVAEYIFVANFLPLRHVCRFRNIVAVSADLSRSPSLMAEIAGRRTLSTP